MSRSVNNGETNAKKLITRPIMTVTSPNSPHIVLTYTKLRFDNFFDHTYPPSWSKLPKCIEIGVVFLSGQKSNPKVRVYHEKFNTKNFPQTFSSGFYICWDYFIQFSQHFPMKIFSPSPSTSPSPESHELFEFWLLVGN